MLINRLQEQLTEVIHATALFEAQTIHDLAAYLRKEYPDSVQRLFPSEPVGSPRDVDAGQTVAATHRQPATSPNRRRADFTPTLRDRPSASTYPHLHLCIAFVTQI